MLRCRLGGQPLSGASATMLRSRLGARPLLMPRTLPRTLATRKARTKTADPEEEIYQRLTPHEHILARPGMYIGSPSLTTQSMWLYDDSSQCMVRRSVKFNSGLYKIFDEILVNALDNRQRDPEGTTSIDVEVDAAGRISIRNDGLGIPVRKHATEDQWVPELIMGELHTGSNFDDSVKRTVGGRHGYGAKLTNIFSRSFEVDTADARAGQRYVQRWADNMRAREAPAITPLPPEVDADYTRVSFLPDYARFQLDGLSDDMRAVLRRRVLEAAACAAPARVTWQGEPVPVRSLSDLIALYAPPPEGEAAAAHMAVAQLTPRWRVGVCVAPPGAGDGGARGGFVDGCSFVNGVATPMGGTHVAAAARALLPPLRAALAPRLGVAAAKLKPADVAPHLMLFVDCLVDNPDFDSQAKERLSSPEARFGGACPQPSVAFAQQASTARICLDPALTSRPSPLTTTPRSLAGGEPARAGREGAGGARRARGALDGAAGDGGAARRRAQHRQARRRRARRHGQGRRVHADRDRGRLGQGARGGGAGGGGA